MSHSKEHKAHLPHVGMRKIKSLLAIFVGFWIWQAVRLLFPSLEVHPLYVYVYGLIEMRDSSQKTVDMGRDRIKATFLAIGIDELSVSPSAVLPLRAELRKSIAQTCTLDLLKS